MKRAMGRLGGALGSPEALADPYPVYLAMRKRDPIYAPAPGIRVLTRFADVDAVLRDRKTSVDPRRLKLNDSNHSVALRHSLTPSLLGTDPPDHTRLRRVASGAFSPRVIASLRSRIESLVEERLVDAADRGTLEVVGDLAYPVAVNVICELLGVPAGDRPNFASWTRELVHSLEPGADRETVARGETAGGCFLQYVEGLVAMRRADPGEDLISRLVHANESGERLTQEDVLSLCMLLLAAGHETTVNLIGLGTLALLRNREQLALLRQDPSLIPAAVDEFARYDGPVQLRNRLAVEDLMLGDRTIPAGTRIVALIGAANRDPERFTDPDRLDVRRGDGGHLAFGAGAHYCLGAQLARLEIAIVLGQLLGRFERIELRAEPVWRPTLWLRGLESLDLTVGP